MTMKINIDKSTFEKIVSSATSSEVYVFESVQDQLELSEQKILSTVLGSQVDIDALPIKEDIYRFVCLDAFYNAMPALDLVLTDTGFGVVNNQNVSPASKDRVESLRKQIRLEADNALDRIINGLIGNAEWSSSAYARLLVSSLYYTADQLRDFAGKPSASRSDLFGLRPLISEAEELIYRDISAVFFSHLLEQIRHNSLTEDEILVVWSLRRAIGYYINKQLPAFRREMENIVNLLEEKSIKFPVYRESEAYKVKHFEYYKNEEDDTCYFWG